MLRAILRAVFGRRDDLASAAQTDQQATPTWREAPAKTWVDDIGSGLVATVSVTTGHHGFVQVVGESHYQDALRTLVARLGSDGIFTARLVPEPNNPHDTNAVAVVIDDQDGEKVGYLARQIAQTYQQRLLNHKSTVTCPARLTGAGFGAVGVVLDFEAVRDALGLPRVSVDQSDMDYEATAEYHRLNGANREFVKETRPLESSDPQQAVARYRQAILALRQCRDLAKEKGLERYGFLANQTDALPLDRLVRCLLKMGDADVAATELADFVREFPHSAEMTLVKDATARLARARK
jgi:hypothetical protein